MKKVWGITMVKDEADIIYHTLLHMAEEGLDGIIVADNMSSDNTLKEIARAANIVSCPIIVVIDEEVGYYQSQKMTSLARLANEKGADWIVPFDCDELWMSNNDNIKNYLSSLPRNVNVVNADLYNHFGTALDVDSDTPFQSMVYRQKQKGALPKVAFRYHPNAVIGQGNHSVDLPNKRAVGGMEIRHFPYRSWDHFKRKAINGLKAYEATDLPEHMGGHWRQYGKLIETQGEEAVRKEVYERWFWFFSPVDNGLIHDPAPFRRWNK